MRERLLRIGGLVVVAAYGVVIAWIYARQPQTMAEVTGGLASSVGVYRVDAQNFADGLRFFHQDQFVEARAAFARADPASRDARTQFYIAYSYYRQAWGRLHTDDALCQQGIDAVDRAIAITPAGRLVVDDPNLQMHTSDELRAELERGRTRDLSDFNPLRLFRSRK